MRIPPGARVYLTTTVSLAGVAVATWCGTQVGASVAGRPWRTLGAVATSVTAAGVPAYEQIRKEPAGGPSRNSCSRDRRCHPCRTTSSAELFSSVDVRHRVRVRAWGG
jgi:hypothetical protein